MKKTVKIEGKEVELVLNGQAPILYRFFYPGRNYFEDLENVTQTKDISLLLDMMFFAASIAQGKVNYGTSEDVVKAELDWFGQFDSPNFYMEENEDGVTPFDALMELVLADIDSKSHSEKAPKRGRKAAN